MYLAHAVWNTVGFTTLHELFCIDRRHEKACTDAYGKSPNGSIYYGRGPFMLSHDYNYRSCSLKIFSNETLLNDPDLVVRDVRTGWLTAAVLWRSKRADFFNSTFGSTLTAIKGVLYCGGERKWSICDLYRKIQIILGDILRDRDEECSCTVIRDPELRKFRKLKTKEINFEQVDSAEARREGDNYTVVIQEPEDKQNSLPSNVEANYSPWMYILLIIVLVVILFLATLFIFKHIQYSLYYKCQLTAFGTTIDQSSSRDTLLN
jgi:hypothetical protein